MNTFYKIAYKLVGAGIIAAGYYAARESGKNEIFFWTLIVGIAVFAYKGEDEFPKGKYRM